MLKKAQAGSIFGIIMAVILIVLFLQIISPIQKILVDDSALFLSIEERLFVLHTGLVVQIRSNVVNAIFSIPSFPFFDYRGGIASFFGENIFKIPKLSNEHVSNSVSLAQKIGRKASVCNKAFRSVDSQSNPLYFYTNPLTCGTVFYNTSQEFEKDDDGKIINMNIKYKKIDLKKNMKTIDEIFYSFSSNNFLRVSSDFKTSENVFEDAVIFTDSKDVLLSKKIYYNKDVVFDSRYESFNNLNFFKTKLEGKQNINILNGFTLRDFENYNEYLSNLSDFKKGDIYFAEGKNLINSETEGCFFKNLRINKAHCLKENHYYEFYCKRVGNELICSTTFDFSENEKNCDLNKFNECKINMVKSCLSTECILNKENSNNVKELYLVTNLGDKNYENRDKYVINLDENYFKEVLKSEGVSSRFLLDFYHSARTEFYGDKKSQYFLTNQLGVVRGESLINFKTLNNKVLKSVDEYDNIVAFLTNGDITSQEIVIINKNLKTFIMSVEEFFEEGSVSKKPFSKIFLLDGKLVLYQENINVENREVLMFCDYSLSGESISVSNCASYRYNTLGEIKDVKGVENIGTKYFGILTTKGYYRFKQKSLKQFGEDPFYTILEKTPFNEPRLVDNQGSWIDYVNGEYIYYECYVTYSKIIPTDKSDCEIFEFDSTGFSTKSFNYAFNNILMFENDYKFVEYDIDYLNKKVKFSNSKRVGQEFYLKKYNDVPHFFFFDGGELRVTKAFNSDEDFIKEVYDFPKLRNELFGDCSRFSGDFSDFNFLTSVGITVASTGVGALVGGGVGAVVGAVGSSVVPGVGTGSGAIIGGVSGGVFGGIGGFTGGLSVSSQTTDGGIFFGDDDDADFVCINSDSRLACDQSCNRPSITSNGFVRLGYYDALQTEDRDNSGFVSGFGLEPTRYRDCNGLVIDSSSITQAKVKHINSNDFISFGLVPSTDLLFNCVIDESLKFKGSFDVKDVNEFVKYGQCVIGQASNEFGGYCEGLCDWGDNFKCG